MSTAPTINDLLVAQLVSRMSGDTERMQRSLNELVRALGRTAQEKEALAKGVPMRSFGPRRPLPFTRLNELRPESWTGIPTMRPGESRSGVFYQGITHVGLWSPEHELLTDFTLEDSRLSNGEKWLSRAYRIQRNVRFVGCQFDTTWEEHGCYFNLAGWGAEMYEPANLGVWARRDAEPTVLWEGCLFRDIAAQAIQLVTPWPGDPQRLEETSDPTFDNTPGGPIIVKNCRFENVEYWHGGPRSSYAVSIFPGRQFFYMEGCELDTTMQTSGKGALYVGGIPEDKRGEAVVRDSVFVMGGAVDRPILQFVNCRKVVLDGCHVEAGGGQNFVQIAYCDEVHVTNCSGTARISDRGQDVGPITTDYHRVP